MPQRAQPTTVLRVIAVRTRPRRWVVTRHTRRGEVHVLLWAAGHHGHFPFDGIPDLAPRERKLGWIEQPPFHHKSVRFEIADISR